MKYKIPFIKPMMPGAEKFAEDYQRIVNTNWFTNFGPREQELSKQIANYIGQDVSVTTVANATLGLILAIKALMVSTDSQRNKVIMPSFTFAAVPESAIWCGLNPVFIDISAESWQPDIAQARAYLSLHKKEVAGILFCNIFGVGAPEIKDWEALAKEYSIPLVIDSAAGFGSQYPDGSRLGSKGDCEVFSFHVTKPFGVGEGAAISGKSSKLIEQIKSLENFGFSKNREVVEVGLNAKMEEINAAIGLWQLQHIDQDVDKRKQVFALYMAALSPLGFTFQTNSERSTICFVSAVAPDSKTADATYSILRENGIEVNRYYNPALHKHPAFSKVQIADSLGVTDDICSRIISLPAHQDISSGIVDLIADKIKNL